MKKQFDEPTELNMDELDLVNGGTGFAEPSEPAMFDDTSGTPAAQNLSDGTHSGESGQIEFLDVGLSMKCTNPNCVKCGIIELSRNRRCKYCGSFLIPVFS